MSNIFDKFDKQVNPEQLQKDIAEAKENSYEEVPAGSYLAKIEKMKLGQTKDERPMFKVQMRLIDGEGTAEDEFLAKYKRNKPCIFMNRVMFGTKNDGNMIASVIGWVNTLGAEEQIEFKSYSNFADDVLDLAEEIEGLEYSVTYDPDKFNSITINDIYDV